MQATRCRVLTYACGAACAALLTVGCEDKKPSNVPPTASATASASAPVRASSSAAPGPKPTFEQLVARSHPLDPKPGSAEVGKVKLSAERCTIEGAAFLHEKNMDVLKAVAVAGDKLYLIDAAGTLKRFDSAPGESCKLTLDTSFGDGGTLKTAREVRTLSSNDRGDVVASQGVFANYFLKDGKVAYECAVPGQGFVQLIPGGGWGLGMFANATVRKITYADSECKSEPWVLQDLGQDDKRKGPFTNVNTIGYLGKLILVGGVLAENIENRRPTVVVAFDEKGKEKLRFGNTDKAARDDNFGWIHAIAACKPGICVLDSNFRRLTLWDKDGKFVGNVKLTELFDLRYPWIPDMARAGKGPMYFVAGQDRGPKSGVSEGLVYRVTGI